MCGAKPPTPTAPPAPIPERDSNIDAMRKRQKAAAGSQQGGVESTMLSQSAGPTGSVASPTLGGGAN
jgi:hypothetical protein